MKNLSMHGYRGFWVFRALILGAMLVVGAGRLEARAALGEIHSVSIKHAAPQTGEVLFSYRAPSAKPRGVLLVVSGYNGDGRGWLRDGGGWAELAADQDLVVLAPSFKVTAEELQGRHGYYYPQEGSGPETLQALERIHQETGAPVDKILIFGFSAGAHFAHRFSNWCPSRVKAFVAYAAGWWDPPSPKLASVPALIMCGEDDERLLATQAYLQAGLALHLPFIWRSYAHTGHAITPTVQRMAVVFLRGAARGERGDGWIGDSQTYEVFPASSPEGKQIPPELRTILPSRAVAEAWRKES